MNSGPSNISGWRNAILSHFTPEIAPFAPVTVVADPDHLMSEQRLLSVMNERGFEVVQVDDPIALRYLYERRFRGREKIANTSRIVIAATETQSIPFDMFRAAFSASRVLSFSLPSLFPHLSPSVITELDRADLDALFGAQQIHQPGQLGENATKDFVLRHVCDVAPELIRNPADLLRVLLQRHYRERQFPREIDQRFILLLRTGGLFGDWPLEQIVSERSSFIQFLQERWERLLRIRAGQFSTGTTMVIPGPEDMPFDHPDIRVYIDSLCLEGALKPIHGISKESLGGTWLAVGINVETEDIVERFKRLTDHIAGQVPGAVAIHADWSTFAYRWAEWSILRNRLSHSDATNLSPIVRDIQSAVDSAFEQWLLNNFGVMGSLSFLPKPVMVHQIGHAMAYGWSPNLTAKKKALIVVDGLAIDQWLILRESFDDTFHIAEGAAFAWIPTLTTISRQSIFAAESPLYFATSLMTTSKEEQHWRRLWENHGVRPDRILYVKQKEKEDTAAFFSRAARAREETECVVFGMVVGVIDDTIHGSAMGMGGLHSQVRYWAQNGHFRNMVDALISEGFDVHVLADHGNIEAQGMGKPKIGVVAEQRGERAHVLPDDLIRRSVYNTFPKSIPWPSIGLPESFLPLIAKGRSAFVAESETIVCHGGVSIEEVIVPYIRIARRAS